MSDKSPDKTVPGQSGLSSGGNPDSREAVDVRTVRTKYLGSPAIYTLITVPAWVLGRNAGQ